MSVPLHRQKLRTPRSSRHGNCDEEVQQLVVLGAPSNQRRHLIGSRGLPVGLADDCAVGSYGGVVGGTIRDLLSAVDLVGRSRSDSLGRSGGPKKQPASLEAKQSQFLLNAPRSR